MQKKERCQRSDHLVSRYDINNLFLFFFDGTPHTSESIEDVQMQNSNHICQQESTIDAFWASYMIYKVLYSSLMKLQAEVIPVKSIYWALRW